MRLPEEADGEGGRAAHEARTTCHATHQPMLERAALGGGTCTCTAQRSNVAVRKRRMSGREGRSPRCSQRWRRRKRAFAVCKSGGKPLGGGGSKSRQRILFNGVQSSMRGLELISCRFSSTQGAAARAMQLTTLAQPAELERGTRQGPCGHLVSLGQLSAQPAAASVVGGNNAGTRGGCRGRGRGRRGRGGGIARLSTGRWHRRATSSAAGAGGRLAVPRWERHIRPRRQVRSRLPSGRSAASGHAGASSGRGIGCAAPSAMWPS
jgi:hypothetical protein